MTPLLDCIMKDGEVQQESVVSLEMARKYCNGALVSLRSSLASLDQMEQVPVKPHDSLMLLFKKAVEENGCNMG